MQDIVIISLGVLALLTALSFKEDQLKPLAGTGWIACGMFVFYDYHLAFLFLSVVTGLYLLLTGVMAYYD